MEDLNTDGEDHAPDALRYGLVFFAKKTSSLADVKSLNEVKREQQARKGPASVPIIATRF